MPCGCRCRRSLAETVSRHQRCTRLETQRTDGPTPTYVYIYLFIHIHIYMYMYMRLYMYMHKIIFILAYICTHTYIYIYIYIYILTQLCNPTASSRVQGCNVIRQGSKVWQGSKIPQRFLQTLGVPRFQSRLLDYQGSRAPSFQGSSFQASRFQTCKGLGLIHQQRNDQRNAKQTQNTIELLQFI